MSYMCGAWEFGVPSESCSPLKNPNDAPISNWINTIGILDSIVKRDKCTTPSQVFFSLLKNHLSNPHVVNLIGSRSPFKTHTEWLDSLESPKKDSDTQRCVSVTLILTHRPIVVVVLLEQMYGEGPELRYDYFYLESFVYERGFWSYFTN